MFINTKDASVRMDIIPHGILLPNGYIDCNTDTLEITDYEICKLEPEHVNEQYADEAIPIGAEIVLPAQDKLNNQSSIENHGLEWAPVTQDVVPSYPPLKFDPEVMETDSGINLLMPTDMSHHIAEEDLEIASLVGIIKWPRPRSLDKTRITPNRKLMRTLLRHIYEVTGQVYEDIPSKFRTSHISLALYLKNCVKYGGNNPLNV